MMSAWCFKVPILLMSVCAVSSSSAEADAAFDDDFDWEDFQATIADEDCFGGHCGSASGALSMLQRKVAKVEIGKEATDTEVGKAKSKPEEFVSELEVSPDDLHSAMMSEGDAVEGASFIQTDAHYEKKDIHSDHAKVAAAVLSDGSLEMKPEKTSLPTEGMVSLSVDMQGDFHQEEALSLMQTEAHIERTSVSPSSSAAITLASVHADGTFEMKPEKTSLPSEGMVSFSVDMHGDFHQEEALSLMQTEAHIERTSVSPSSSADAFAAVRADGSLEMSPQKATSPNDGMMHISVDAQGEFHGEDALSLIQTDAHVERKGIDSPPEIAKEMFSDDDVYDFGMSVEEAEEAAPAISLLQTGFQLERVGASSETLMSGAVNADGTFEMNPHKTDAPATSLTHVSVDAMGHAHLEI